MTEKKKQDNKCHHFNFPYKPIAWKSQKKAQKKMPTSPNTLHITQHLLPGHQTLRPPTINETDV